MTGGAEVIGGEAFARTLHGFADDVRHLDAAHAAAGAEVARLAAGRARRRTGALAASFAPTVTEAGVRIGSALRYAGVQEYGNPRHHITPSYALTSALEDAAPAVDKIYTGAVDDALGKVRGK